MVGIDERFQTMTFSKNEPPCPSQVAFSESGYALPSIDLPVQKANAAVCQTIAQKAGLHFSLGYPVRASKRKL